MAPHGRHYALPHPLTHHSIGTGLLTPLLKVLICTGEMCLSVKVHHASLSAAAAALPRTCDSALSARSSNINSAVKIK